MSPVKIGVLISGQGSNLQALIDQIAAGKINGQITVVIADRKDAYGLVRAKSHQIKTVFVDRKSFSAETEFNREILSVLAKNAVELIVLAGYLRILSAEVIHAYNNRIINIHPALIPSFCGKGYYGKKVHQAVLDYGVKLTGATVHFVDEGTDTGPIISQQAVAVEPDDTVESLQNKVLKLEHLLLPEAVMLYCAGKLKIDGRRVWRD
jgi:phosphoribosylglycinamide formyltransferase-1